MSDTQSSRETQAPADDPIERAARAALRARAFLVCSDTTLALEVNGIRAALRELREPSTAMIAAGRKHTDLRQSWRAMVDDLLAEGERRD